jgi:DNA-binding NarL/FixJ family response regulator
MHKRRVVILYTHALFGQGIAQLLQSDDRLEVTCLRADLPNATEQLRQLQPRAIVMEGCESSSLLSLVVQDLPPALFIAVHFEDNLMDVYQDRQVVAARPETLVEAIHHGLAAQLQPALRQD